MVDPERVTYGEHPEQFVDQYCAAGDPKGTIFLIHGGYWRVQYGLDINTPIALHCASEGWDVLNIEYRRIERGQHGVWAEMSHDVAAACSLAAPMIQPVIAVGHSAGGQLALWAAAQPDSPIDAVIALAPVADLIASDELHLSNSATHALFGGSASDLPDIYAAASPRHILPLGLPQMIVHGQADDTVPHDFATDYVRAALDAGDTVSLVDPIDVDHYDVIDPRHNVWRAIDDQLDAWACELR